jgi:hypothetical protein
MGKMSNSVGSSHGDEQLRSRIAASARRAAQLGFESRLSKCMPSTEHKSPGIEHHQELIEIIRGWERGHHANARTSHMRSDRRDPNAAKKSAETDPTHATACEAPGSRVSGNPGTSQIGVNKRLDR